MKNTHHQVQSVQIGCYVRPDWSRLVLSPKGLLGVSWGIVSSLIRLADPEGIGSCVFRREHHDSFVGFGFAGSSQA